MTSIIMFRKQITSWLRTHKIFQLYIHSLYIIYTLYIQLYTQLYIHIYIYIHSKNIHFWNTGFMNSASLQRILHRAGWLRICLSVMTTVASAEVPWECQRWMWGSLHNLLHEIPLPIRNQVHIYCENSYTNIINKII